MSGMKCRRKTSVRVELLGSVLNDESTLYNLNSFKLIKFF